MKRSIIALIAICCVATPLFAQSGDEDAIRKVIDDFAVATDTQNPEMLDSLILAKTLQFVLRPQDQLLVPKEEYVELLKAKKIGGKKRPFTIHTIELFAEDIASVTAEACYGEHVWHYLFSLAKQQNRWIIVNIVVKFS